MATLFRSMVAAALCCAPMAFGCKPSEEIEHYKVAREILDNKPPATDQQPQAAENTAGADASKPNGVPSSAPAEPVRMLAAIVPHENQGWFFKLEGSKQAVSEQVEPFKELVKSVHFDAEGHPEWTLPAGWKQLPASGIRYATLALDNTKTPLEVSVTTLGKPPGDDATYNLMNVNRWRGQLGLAALRPDGLAAASETIKLADGATALMVCLAGVKKAGGMGGPFSGQAGPPSVERSPSAEAPRTEGKTPPPIAAPGGSARMLAAIVPHGEQDWFFKLDGSEQAAGELVEPFKKFVQSVHFDAAGQPQWTLPEGWKQLPASGLRFATISLGGEKTPLEISVTALGKPPGDDAAYNLINVNRWRGQLGLAALPPDGLAAASETIKLADGATALMVNLVGVKKAGGMGGPFSGAGNGK